MMKLATPTIDIGREETEREFIRLVNRALRNLLQRTRFGEVHIVEIDGWFDYKWQEFSGTVMHEIAVWRHKLTVPPFHPSRVLSEKQFQANGSEFFEILPARPLHIPQTSTANLTRCVSDISSSGAFVWYSHVNTESDRASLMLYTSGPSEASGWYAGFVKKDQWRIGQVKGAARKAVEELILS